jgi:hypothetical protein
MADDQPGCGIIGVDAFGGGSERGAELAGYWVPFGGGARVFPRWRLAAQRLQVPPAAVNWRVVVVWWKPSASATTCAGAWTTRSRSAVAVPAEADLLYPGWPMCNLARMTR